MTKISLGIIGGGQLGSLLCAAAKNINKKPMPSTGGRPPYMYFAIQKNF